MKATRKGATTKALQWGPVDRIVPVESGAPGTVVHDFNVVLDFVGTTGVHASGKHGLLSIEAIPTLDQRLARPLNLNLARPLLRSHPYLMGLQLLLRASGLGQVRRIGKKTTLFIDDSAYSTWKSLNQIEQYCGLLEAWLLNGDDEMTGEDRGRDAWSAFLHYWSVLRHVEHRESLRLFYEQRGRFVFALMDMFGLVTLECPSVTSGPWAPESVKRTSLGRTIFDVIAKWDEKNMFQQPHMYAPGTWQSLLRPLFPNWQKSLLSVEPEPKNGTVVFKVAIGRAWRRLAIDSSATLDELAHAILNSVEFDDDHLYEFIYQGRYGKTVRVLHPEMDEDPCTAEIQVGSLPLDVGQEMEFHFDFGDDWRFSVILEEIDEKSGLQAKPKVLETHGAAPIQYRSFDE